MAKKVVKKKENSKEEGVYSLIAYIIGIVGLVEAFFSPIAGIAFGIIGIVIAKKEKNILSKKAKRLNTIAIIAGVVIFALITLISFLSLSQIGTY